MHSISSCYAFFAHPPSQALPIHDQPPDRELLPLLSDMLRLLHPGAAQARCVERCLGLSKTYIKMRPMEQGRGRSPLKTGLLHLEVQNMVFILSS